MFIAFLVKVSIQDDNVCEKKNCNILSVSKFAE